MGFKKIINTEDFRIGIWQIESEIKKNDLINTNLINIKSEKRKKEKIAVRLLLNEMNIKSNLGYTKYGAPKIEGSHISITHSSQFVAIIISHKKTGIDIEKISVKALTISSKFINQQNFKNITKEKATIIWCVKEAVFKLLENKKLRFKDIIVQDFNVNKSGLIYARLKKCKYTLRYILIDNHFLVYVCKHNELRK